MTPYAEHRSFPSRDESRDQHLRRRRRATWATVACVVVAGVVGALLAVASRLT